MRLAAVDIGTNSTRLLIADYVQGRVNPVLRELEMTRIGEGIGVSGTISQQALERTLACVSRFLETCSQYNVIKVKIAATSAVRDASNKNQVIDAIYSKTGHTLEVLTGTKEAELSYLGAISDYLGGVSVNYIVLDIGGGSTELIYYNEDGIHYKSINLGAVRIKENLTLQEKATQMLDVLHYNPFLQDSKLVGVGGTITTLAAIKLKMAKYDPDIIHGQILKKEEIARIYTLLNGMELAERQKVKGLRPGRADIITYGIYILLKVMDKLNITQVIVSEKDILYGMIIKCNNGEC